MSDYSSKTAMVIAHPLFLELACRLARDFGKVYYWNPGADATFPTAQQGMVGYGMEGVTVVDSWAGPHFDSVDLFVFPDLYQAALQIHLEGLGKRVWGARNGEELEIYRGTCKELMEKEDLPVQPWGVVKGIKALRNHLMEFPDQHVKIDRYRGNFETFFSPDYDLVATKLDEIAHNLGPLQEVIEFMVEDDLPDKVEAGLDTYCIDGDYPLKTLCGIEVKDLGYLGQFVSWDSIPEPLTRWTTAMAPYLRRYGYRGFLSNEIRIGKDHVPYMIDACMRAGSPPSELYQEFYTNFSEIIWEGADGFLVDPKPIAKFGLQVVMKSEWAQNNPQPVSIDPKVRQNVKLYNPIKVKDGFSVLPQDDNMAEVGSVIGWGETVEEALKMVDKVSEGVKGYGIKIPKGSAEDAIAEAEKLNEIGLKVFDLDSSPKA